MLHRRNFLKTSIFSSGALLFNGQSATGQQLKAVKNKPVVISTWNFGKAANAAAWKVLSEKGRALNAVVAFFI